MINRLRTKFIILSTVSLLLLLAVIVTSSSLLTYRELVVNADTVLDMLADRATQDKKPILPKPSKNELPLNKFDETDEDQNDIHIRRRGFLVTKGYPLRQCMSRGFLW